MATVVGFSTDSVGTETDFSQLTTTWGAAFVVDNAAAMAPTAVTTSDRTVRVASGAGRITSLRANLPAAETVQLPPNNTGGNRIDAVVLRTVWAATLGQAAHTTQLMVVPGTPAVAPVKTSGSPSATSINRQPGVIYDAVVAVVTTPNGVGALTNLMIDDLRAWGGIGGPFVVGSTDFPTLLDLPTAAHVIFANDNPASAAEYVYQSTQGFTGWSPAANGRLVVYDASSYPTVTYGGLQIFDYTADYGLTRIDTNNGSYWSPDVVLGRELLRNSGGGGTADDQYDNFDPGAYRKLLSDLGWAGVPQGVYELRGEAILSAVDGGGNPIAGISTGHLSLQVNGIGVGANNAPADLMGARLHYGLTRYVQHLGGDLVVSLSHQSDVSTGRVFRGTSIRAKRLGPIA